MRHERYTCWPAVAVASLLMAASLASAAAVHSGEGARVAQWWLARELNGTWSRVPQSIRNTRLAALDQPQVQAIWKDGQMFRCGNLPAADVEAAAHVVVFPHGGYVVVSGDDRMPPVLAFDGTRPFVWEGDGGAIARVLLGRMLTSWRAAIAGGKGVAVPLATNPAWTTLRTKLVALADPRTIPAGDDGGPQPLTINIQLATASWSQGGFYNDTLQTHVGNNNGVPVACTATAMAILMRYFEWPATGIGSEGYWDVCNGLNYYHSVALGATYDWGSMPVGSLTSVNADVADLMYHCGVMVGMDYEVGGSGAWPSATVMNGNFRYRGTWDITSGHEAHIIACIKARVPVVLSSHTHTMVCDGYRDTSAPAYYHINAGHDGGSDGWYSLTTLPATDTTIDASYPYSTPNNFAYADVGHSGSENGDLDSPYNTVGEGVSGVTSGGHLWLKGGTYTGAITIDKAMTLRAYDGNAVLQ